MKYIAKMNDEKVNKEIVLQVESDNVFDAVSKSARMIENPYQTKLIEAYPVREESK